MYSFSLLYGSPSQAEHNLFFFWIYIEKMSVFSLINNTSMMTFDDSCISVCKCIFVCACLPEHTRSTCTCEWMNVPVYI